MLSYRLFVKKNQFLIIVCLASAILCPFSLFADNQLIPGNKGTSDPAPMVENGKLYLYCTVDAIGNGDLSIYDISCHSTEDLYHWKDEGIVLTEKDIPWAAQKGNLWAPHCIKLGGRFHLYFPANDGWTFRIGHAVADSPTGTFIPDDSYMQGCGSNAIDPFVYLDTVDGGSTKAYIAWNIVGRTPNEVYIRELNSTFDNAVGEQYDITGGLGSSTRYKEGIWIIKQNGLFYNFVADWTGAVECISYSTAPNLFGPYTKRGTVLNENTNSATIHCGVVNFLGEWVIFYHTGGNEIGGTINSGTKRVTGAEYLYFDESDNPWSIPRISKTYRGVGVPFSYDTIQIDRHSPSGIHNGSTSVVGGGEPRGWMVSNIRDNGYIRYNNVNFSNTDKNSGEIRARVASNNAEGSIEVRVDGQSGTLIGMVSVPSTGGLTQWQTVTAPVSSEGLAVNGTRDIFLVFRTTPYNQYNVNWISIGEEQTTDILHAEKKKFSNDVQIHSIRNRAVELSVSGNNTIQKICVFNIKGQEIKNNVSKISGHNTFIVSNIPSSGMYILLIKKKSETIRTPLYFSSARR